MLESLLEPLKHVFDAIASACSRLISDRHPPPLMQPRPEGLTLSNGRILINGVELSPLVVDQLRRAGFNPAWCNNHELQSAKRAAAVDCQVFDEHGSDNFYDGLELDKDEEEKLMAPYRPKPYDELYERAMTFVERLKRERETPRLSLGKGLPSTA